MRLLMTVDAVGGVWTYAMDLAVALTGQGVTTTLAILGPSPTAAQAAAARDVVGVSLVDTGLPLDWCAGSEAEIGRIAREVALLARGADIVHLNGPSLAAFGSFRQPVVGVCHSCTATWWEAVRGDDRPDEDQILRTHLLARGYGACDALVSPSASFAAATHRLYGRWPQVIHNGRAATTAVPGTRERLVLTAGRLWDDGKNVAALDHAASLLDAPVFAAGPLAGPAGGAKVLRHVRALGRLDAATLQDWMGRAPVFASMARYEPFGLSVLEAAQAGCALVLSEIPTFRELWGGAAIFVPPQDPGVLAKTLQDLLDAPARTSELGRAARHRARRYAIAPMARAMADLYRRTQAHTRQAATA